MDNDAIETGVRYFSWSQLYISNVCEWRWALHYIHRWKSPRRYRAPTLGSAVHEGVAGAIKGLALHQGGESYGTAMENAGEAIDAWAAKEREKTHDLDTARGEEANAILDECQAAALPIVMGWEAWMDWDEWETVQLRGHPLVEYPVTTRVEGSHVFLGILDWVARHKPTNLTYVIDWKVRTAAMTPVEQEETNLQKAAYQFMLGQAGVPTHGSRICQIWHKPPGIPKETQKGAMSRAKIRTTWDVWQQEAVARGHDLDEYLEMQDKCNPIEDFYRWSPAHRSTVELGSIWEDVIGNRVSRLLDLYGGAPATRSLGSRDCHMCNVRDACMETLRGTSWGSAMSASGLYYTEQISKAEMLDTDDQQFEVEVL